MASAVLLVMEGHCTATSKPSYDASLGSIFQDFTILIIQSVMLRMYSTLICMHIRTRRVEGSPFCLCVVAQGCSSYLSLEPVICPDLDNPVNGTVMVNGTSPGDTATYFCNMGFELEGADTVTCRDDGTWSVGPPVCRRELSHD